MPKPTANAGARENRAFSLGREITHGVTLRQTEERMTNAAFPQDNYPPGMTMREFDRATAGEEDPCLHGEQPGDCEACEYDAYSEHIDRKLDELRGK